MRDRATEEYHGGAVPFKTSVRPLPDEVLKPGDRRILSDSNGNLYKTVCRERALRYLGRGKRTLERYAKHGDVIRTGARYDVHSLIRLSQRNRKRKPAPSDRAYWIGRLAAQVRDPDSCGDCEYRLSTPTEEVFRLWCLAVESGIQPAALFRGWRLELTPDPRELLAERLARRPDVLTKFLSRLGQLEKMSLCDADYFSEALIMA